MGWHGIGRKVLGKVAIAVIAPVAAVGVLLFVAILIVGKPFGVRYYDYPDAERIK